MISNNGGPAFPIVETDPIDGSRVTPGMKLRDWFAGQALAGIGRRVGWQGIRLRKYHYSYINRFGSGVVQDCRCNAGGA